MKTTKLLVAGITLVASLTVSNAFAQGLYVKGNAGFGMGIGDYGLLADGNSTVTNGTSTSTTTGTDKAIKLSFGKGLNFGGGLGYMFTEHVGFEVGVNYLIGGETKSHDVTDFGSGSRTVDIALSAKMLRINPCFVISAGGDGASPYARVGVVLGSGKFIAKETSIGASGESYQETEFSGGLGLGFNAAIGLDYGVSDKLSLFGELNFIGMSYAPTKSEIVKYTADGVDELSLLTTNEKKVEYVNSYSYDTSQPESDDAPSKDLKHSFPFSSFGLNVGVKFKF